MPGYKFKDSDNFSAVIDDADYIFKVIGVAFSISRGKATSGSDVMELKLAFYKGENRVSSWTENLILHESTGWRVDTFLKAADYRINGNPPQENEQIDFRREDLLGLRGWCRTEREEYEGNTRSRVKQWLTDRPKLPREAVQGKQDSLPESFK